MINPLETRKIGTHELQLPSFMSTLPQHAIDQFEHHEQKVVSCGIDPQDGVLYMITPMPQVKILRTNGDLKPIDAFPSGNGDMLAVSFESIEGYFGIKSASALQVADNCINSAGMFINDTYMCNLELIDVQVVTDQNEDNLK